MIECTCTTSAAARLNFHYPPCGGACGRRRRVSSSFNNIVAPCRVYLYRRINYSVDRCGTIAFPLGRRVACRPPPVMARVFFVILVDVVVAVIEIVPGSVDAAATRTVARSREPGNERGRSARRRRPWSPGRGCGYTIVAENTSARERCLPTRTV